MTNTKVLIVEDNPINIIVLKKFIEHLCTLDVVNNGVKALEMIEKNDYALILMDINLGTEQMSGIDVLNQVRANEQFKQLPIIAITAYVTEDSTQQFKEQGFTDVVHKPIDRDRIAYILSRYISKTN
ncbi:MAG: response regulator [Thermoflexibacter sp.]|jgi:CheY-like chemotaxis protein|nr:response regulator [Thermoflexibacter sp.]